MSLIAKASIVFGVLLILFGVVLHLSGGSIPWGRLPGDIHLKFSHFEIFIPITTSILIGAILSLIFTLLFKK